MELLDSAARVTWDPDGIALVLVEIGDTMWSPVQVDGQQVVDVAPGLNRTGVRNYPRGNETHRITWTLARVTAGVGDALQARIAQAMAAPRDMKDVLISFSSGPSVRLKNAAVSSWPGDQVEHITRETLVIQGGELVADGTAPVDPAFALDTAALSLSCIEGLLNAGGSVAANLEPLAKWQNGGAGADATQATSGARPTVLRGPGLWLPGVAGNYSSRGDGTEIELTAASFGIRFDGTLPTYRPAAAVCLASKWTETGNQRSWRVMLNTDGTVILEWSTDGSAGTIESRTSTVALPLSPGEPLYLRVHKDGTQLTFNLHASMDDSPWAQLGDAITVSATAPVNTTAPLNIGATEGGTLNILRGLVRRVALMNPLTTGTVGARFVASFDEGAATASNGDGSIPYAITVNRTGAEPAKLLTSAAPRFDGTNDFLALATPAALNAGSGITLAWMGSLNKVTGTQDLVYCGTAGANPRALLRVNGTSIEVHARRVDGETTGVVSFAAGLAALAVRVISATIDFTAGTATIYLDGSPKASGPLTSSGTGSSTDSSETLVMCGHGGANFAAGDVQHVYVDGKPLNLYDHIQMVSAILAKSG